MHDLGGNRRTFDDRGRRANLARYIDEAVAAEQKGFIFLQISDSYMGFDKPANPNVDYLAAVQAVFAFCHRRVSCNEFAFTETRLIMTAIYSPTK